MGTNYCISGAGVTQTYTPDQKFKDDTVLEVLILTSLAHFD